MRPPDEICGGIINQQDERDDVSDENRFRRLDPVERRDMLIEEYEIWVQAPRGLYDGIRISRHGEDAMAETLELRGEMPGDEIFLLCNQDMQRPQNCLRGPSNFREHRPNTIFPPGDR